MNTHSKSSFNIPQLLKDCRIGIIGIGLMGGSLALALRSHCDELIGIDQDEQTLTFAQSHHYVDRASTNLNDFIGQVDVLIFATPIHSTIQILKELNSIPGQPLIVLDLGSTKRMIMDVMEKLPEWIDPIGGHPMCGKELSSIYNSEKNLFIGAPFALIPLNRTTQRAKNIALELVQAIGAHEVWLDPTQHDQWVAATSHFPYLVSCILSITIPKEALVLTGPGLKSMTRIAGTSLGTMYDIISSNRNHIINRLNEFRTALDKLAFILTLEKDQELIDLILKSQEQYRLIARE